MVKRHYVHMDVFSAQPAPRTDDYLKETGHEVRAAYTADNFWFRHETSSHRLDTEAPVMMRNTVGYQVSRENKQLDKLCSEQFADKIRHMTEEEILNMNLGLIDFMTFVKYGNGFYLPAEIGLIKVSIKEGMSPGSEYTALPQIKLRLMNAMGAGYAFEAKESREKIHGIDVFEEKMTVSVDQFCREIEHELKEDMLLLCRSEDYDRISGCWSWLQRFAGLRKKLNVLTLEEFLSHTIAHLSKLKNQPRTLFNRSQITELMSKSKYNYASTFRCAFHNSDAGCDKRGCALKNVKKYFCFMVELLSEFLDFELKNHAHFFEDVSIIIQNARDHQRRSPSLISAPPNSINDYSASSSHPPDIAPKAPRKRITAEFSFSARYSDSSKSNASNTSTDSESIKSASALAGATNLHNTTTLHNSTNLSADLIQPRRPNHSVKDLKLDDRRFEDNVKNSAVAEIRDSYYNTKASDSPKPQNLGGSTINPRRPHPGSAKDKASEKLNGDYTAPEPAPNPVIVTTVPRSNTSSPLSEPLYTERRRNKHHTSDKRIRIKFLVPFSTAGAIIGTKGESINKMKSDTDTHIHLSETKVVFPGTKERIVMVTGMKGGVLEVFRRICRILRSEFIAKDFSCKCDHRCKCDCKEKRRSIMKCIVPATIVPKIIGHNGWTVNKLEEDCNVVISITPMDKIIPGLDERGVDIIGDEENVNKAGAQILDLLQEFPQLRMNATLLMYSNYHSKEVAADEGCKCGAAERGQNYNEVNYSDSWDKQASFDQNTLLEHIAAAGRQDNNLAGPIGVSNQAGSKRVGFTAGRGRARSKGKTGASSPAMAGSKPTTSHSTVESADPRFSSPSVSPVPSLPEAQKMETNNLIRWSNISTNNGITAHNSTSNSSAGSESSAVVPRKPNYSAKTNKNRDCCNLTYDNEPLKPLKRSQISTKKDENTKTESTVPQNRITEPRSGPPPGFEVKPSKTRSTVDSTVPMFASTLSTSPTFTPALPPPGYSTSPPNEPIRSPPPGFELVYSFASGCESHNVASSCGSHNVASGCGSAVPAVNATNAAAASGRRVKSRGREPKTNVE